MDMLRTLRTMTFCLLTPSSPTFWDRDLPRHRSGQSESTCPAVSSASPHFLNWRGFHVYGENQVHLDENVWFFSSITCYVTGGQGQQFVGRDLGEAVQNSGGLGGRQSSPTVRRHVQDEDRGRHGLLWQREQFFDCHSWKI